MGPYAGRQEPTSFPYYYRWHFRTGDRGDFRYLVRLLKPQPVDPTVGTRDFDVRPEAPNLPGIFDPGLNGILRLGGALEVPDIDLSDADKRARQSMKTGISPIRDSFEVSLARFINLADDYSAQTAKDANAAKRHQSWNHRRSRSPDHLSAVWTLAVADSAGCSSRSDGSAASNPTNWVHRLNLDPRFRVPANFGTEVIETNAGGVHELRLGADW